MANTIVEFVAAPGLTLSDVELSTIAAPATVVNGGGDSATEIVSGVYQITVTEALTGRHYLRAKTASGALKVAWITEDLVDDTGTYRCSDWTDVSTIADAVWDEAADDHTTDGTIGKAFGGATNVYVAGLAGTLNTLDALDAAQDTQHGTTQTAIGNLNNLSEAGVRTAVGLATANLDTQLGDLPTVSEFEARTIVAANYATASALATVDSNVDAVLVETGTTIPGLISGLNDPAAAAIADAVLDELLSEHTTAGTLGKAVADTLADTNELQGNQGAWATATIVDLNPDQSGVTIGTVTTNSDMRGTDNAATASALSTVATNVSTLLTRIPATLFAGITSLAQWIGLLAGKQTGDSTARTELRATGAGSGTFDETTDSLEAVRERGDDGWATATGFSTHSVADVWAAGIRTLTANDNLNDPSETAIADAVLARAVSNVEDTADRHSLAGLVMISTNSEVSGTDLLAKKPSDDSTFATYVLTFDASAAPVTGVS